MNDDGESGDNPGIEAGETAAPEAASEGDTDDGRRWRNWLLTALRYVLGLAALAWVLSQVDWRRLVVLVVELPPAVVAAVAAVTVVGVFIRFYTWQLLIDRVNPVGLVEAGRIDLSVFFINQLFPSRLSGRSVAPLVIRQRVGASWSDAVAITGVHTGLYALLYGVVALVGVGLARMRLSPGVLAVVGLSAALYLVAGVLVLVAGVNMRVIERVGGLVEAVGMRLPVAGDRVQSLAAKLPGFAVDSATRFRGLVSRPGTVARYAVGWAGVMLLAPGIRVGLLLDGLGSGFDPVVLLPVYLVMAYSVTLLPLTPGGIGISEATATLVFVGLGLPVEVVAPVVFLDRLLGVYLPALAGALPVSRLDFSELVP